MRWSEMSKFAIFACDIFRRGWRYEGNHYFGRFDDFFERIKHGDAHRTASARGLLAAVAQGGDDAQSARRQQRSEGGAHLAGIKYCDVFWSVSHVSCAIGC